MKIIYTKNSVGETHTKVLNTTQHEGSYFLFYILLREVELSNL